MSTGQLITVDHLVYAVPDLDAAVPAVEARLGVRLRAGGQHPGRGTRNALLSLGPGVYLEVIGPDHGQPAPDAPRWFGIDALAQPALVGWAARTDNIDESVAQARAAGIALGDIVEGRRVEPDGTVLSWRCTDPRVSVADGLVPFLIDWTGSTHPSRSASDVALVELRAEHPDPPHVRELLSALGTYLDVRHASHAALVARLSTADGEIELR